MSIDEARKILNVSPNATRQQIGAAAASLCRKYVTQLQYATKPPERDFAAVALAKVQEAQHALIKAPVSTPIKPPRAASASAASAIPRVSLGGTRARAQTAACTPVPTAAARARTPARTQSSAAGPVPARSPGRTRPSFFREKAVAALICLAMFVLALALLAGAWR
jgi:hypothetical protein